MIQKILVKWIIFLIYYSIITQVWKLIEFRLLGFLLPSSQDSWIAIYAAITLTLITEKLIIVY